MLTINRDGKERLCFVSPRDIIMCNQYKSTGRCCAEVTVCMRRIVRKLVFRSDLCMSHFIKFSVTSAAKVYVTTRSQCIETMAVATTLELLEKHRASLSIDKPILVIIGKNSSALLPVRISCMPVFRISKFHVECQPCFARRDTVIRNSFFESFLCKLKYLLCNQKKRGERI